SYSGLTTINAGTLTVQHANAVGSTTSGTRVESGASLIIDGVAVGTEGLTLIGTGVSGNGALQAVGTCSWAGATTLASGVTIGGAGSGTLSGAMSGNFALTKAGAGTWTLSGNSSSYVYAIGFFDGSSGRLVAAHNNALGTASSVTVTSGDTLELSGASIPSGKSLTMSGTGNDAGGCLQATGAGNVWAGAVTLAAASTIGGGGSGLISGNIGGNQALTKAGVGSWDLSGSNTLSGVTITTGILRASSTSSLGTAAATPVTNNAILEINGVTLANPSITMNDTSILRGVGAAGCSRAMILTTGQTSTFTYSSSTDVLTISGAFSSQGSLIIDGVVGTVGGKVVLSGNSSAWNNGNITVNQYATLEATGNNNSLGIAGGTGVITVNSGGTLRCAASATATLTFARGISFSGDGVDGNGALIGVDNGAFIGNLTGGLTLTAPGSIGGIGNNTQHQTGVITGDFTLTKRGTGLWYLLGNSSTWSGNVDVVAGTLKVNATATNVSALGNTTGTTTVQSGATLLLSFNSGIGIAEPITISGSGVGGNGAITGAPGGGITVFLSGVITLATDAAVGCSGTGVIRLDGAITGANNLTKVDVGQVQLNADNSAWGGNITVANGTLGFNTATALGDTVGTTTVQNGATLKQVLTTLSLNEKVSIVGAGYGGNGALWAGNNSLTWGGTITMTGNATINTPGFSEVWNGVISDGGNNYTLTVITGAVVTTTSTFSATNTYGGGTNITGSSTLVVTNTQALGTPSASAIVTVSSGATLRLSVNGATMGAYPLVLAGTGSGTGSVNGALQDNGTNGTTTSLAAGSTITLAADATINVANTTHTLDIAGAISGAFTLTKTGPASPGGTLILNAASPSWTGGSTVSAGTLNIKNDGALGTAAGTTTVASGANLTLTGASTPSGKPLIIGGTGIAGAGGLIYSGTSGWGGTVALTADTTFVGTGTCTIGGSLSGGFNLTKTGSATLVLNGDSSGYANTIAFTDGSSGKIVAGHNNALGTAAGLTVISGDILELNSASIPSGKTLTISGNGGGATVGALRLMGVGSGWAGPVTLAAATTIGGTGSGTISGVISGAFNLTKCDTSVLTLSGDNSGYANTIAFQDGSSGRIVA
ncbi:MAG: autotransporter-associated beta strand repeat-containing protein, partial [Planctomycetota bacterium]